MVNWCVCAVVLCTKEVAMDVGMSVSGGILFHFMQNKYKKVAQRRLENVDEIFTFQTRSTKENHKKNTRFVDTEKHIHSPRKKLNKNH